MKRRALAAAFWLAAGFAMAEEAEPLGEAAVRAVLLGFDLAGAERNTGAVWNECIDLRGDTRWRIAGFESRGRLEVKADGQACFRYEHTDYQDEECWIVRREGENLRFDHVSGQGGIFIAETRRRVGYCGQDAPVA